MGCCHCCCSSDLPGNAEIFQEIPQLQEWMPQFQSLALTEQAVEKFWKIYKKVDLDESGSIEIKEMLVHFDIDRTKFTKRVFGVFDEDNSGEIDLREFILALWNYCTLGKATLVIFAFDLYDSDGSGCIEPHELDNMLKEVYGRHWSSNVYATRIAQNIQGIAHSFIDIEAFGKFVKKHPALLFPAYDMQRKLQKFTLGQRYWKRLAEKRLQLSNGEFVPIKKFMALHLDKLIKEDKEKYQMDRLMTFATSTSAKSIKGTKDREKKPESTKSDTANSDLLARRVSSIAVDISPSAKEGTAQGQSGKSSRSGKGSTVYHSDLENDHKTRSADITDISTETPAASWMSASRSSKGGARSSKKRGTNALSEKSGKYNHTSVRDKRPQIYKGDAVSEALQSGW